MNINVNISLHNKVREGVHQKWDPIGVVAYSDEMGEYDSYIPALCKLIEEGASQQQIMEYLWMVETVSIGLEGDREQTEKFANWLYELKPNSGILLK